MSNASNLSTLANVLDDGTSGQVLTYQGSGVVAFADAASGTGVTVHNNQAAMLTDAASADEGSLHYENDNNKLYVKQSSGFFLLASITNTAPTVSDFTETTGGGSANTILDNGTFALTSGSNTVITLTATEPDLETLVYSATVTSGTASNVISSPSLPISNQSGNTFTLTPVTSGVGGTITIRFDVSDGNNVVNKTHSFLIAFTVVDSNHTTLLAAAASSSGSPYSFSGLSYANKSFSFTSQDSSNNGLAFNPNGTKMYMTGSANDVIYQYSLNSAWDVSTASYDNVSLSMSGYSSGSQYSIEFKSDGSVMYISDNSQDSIDIYTVSSGSEYVLNQYSYNSTKSLSAISGITNLRSIIFKPDGSKFFALCNSTNKVYEFTMSTDWDVANAQHSSSDTYDVFSAVSESSPRSAYVTPDGTQLLVSGSNNDKIHRFVLTSPWQVNSATYTSGDDFDFSGTFGTSSCVTMVASDDGTFLYLNTANNDTVYQYNFTSNNNSTITDSSSNNHNITVNGDTHAGTFSPYRSGGYSTYFDGTGDFLEGPAVDLLGSGAFTVECWAYIFSTGSVYTDAFLAQYQSNQKFIFGVKSDVLRVWMSGSEVLIGTTNIVGGWHHFALVRDSNNNCQVYVDGNAEGSSFSNSTDFSSSLENFEIGSWDNGANSSLNGYITDLKVVKGTAITPPSGGPTERLEAVTNTSLLTCHLPYIGDGSSNDYSITLNGNVSTKPFSPYDYSEYDAADHGGSLYFNGTNSAVEIADNDDFDFGTGDLTIECWVYPEVTSNSYPGFLGTSAGWGSIAASGFRFDNLGDSKFQMSWYGPGDPFLETQSTYKHNQWYHFVVTRTGGSTWRMFVNGILEDTGTNSTAYDISIGGNNLQVGGKTWDGGNGWFKGNVADLRLTKGSVVSEYQTTSTTVGTKIFTPRTSPISSSGSELHLKGTDASIIDKSQGTNLNLAGGTTGSTTQAKFSNTKSMYFDGTDDYIIGPTISDLNIGTGDFTVECWLYETTTNTNKGIWDGRSTYIATDGFTFTRIGTDTFRVWSGSALITTGSFNIQNNWNHCALVRSNGTLSIYINGNRSGTPVSNSTNFSSSGKLIIGAGNHSSGSTPNAYITGYIQDFRVSNFARYTDDDETSNIPSAPLEG